MQAQRRWRTVPTTDRRMHSESALATRSTTTHQEAPGMKTIKTRSRPSLLLALLALSLPVAAVQAQGNADPIRQTLEQAKESSARSVTVHVNGSAIALLVTEVSSSHVIGRSAQHERIVVRLDRIDAVAY